MARAASSAPARSSWSRTRPAKAISRKASDNCATAFSFPSTEACGQQNMNIATTGRRLLCMALVAFAAAHAQSYPVKPVTVVVPFPPGGSSDVIARLINAKLTEAFKQNFLTDNRPGAGTLIGTVHVA